MHPASSGSHASCKLGLAMLMQPKNPDATYCAPDATNARSIQIQTLIRWREAGADLKWKRAHTDATSPADTKLPPRITLCYKYTV